MIIRIWRAKGKSLFPAGRYVGLYPKGGQRWRKAVSEPLPIIQSSCPTLAFTDGRAAAVYSAMLPNLPDYPVYPREIFGLDVPIPSCRRRSVRYPPDWLL